MGIMKQNWDLLLARSETKCPSKAILYLYLSPSSASTVPDLQVVELGLECLDGTVGQLEVLVEAVALLNKL